MLKFYVFSFLMFFFYCSNAAPKTSKTLRIPKIVKEFNQKYLPIILEEVEGTGIPEVVAVNQIREETGFCTSKIFKKKFNTAGIKNRKTGDYESYKTFREGVRGYIKRLKDKRYKKAFKTSNPRKFLEEVISARYCEKNGKPDWGYVDRVMNLNKRYPIREPKIFDYSSLSFRLN